MPAHSTVPYTPYPTEQSGGGGGNAMGVHASPNDFGANVSEAIKQTGDLAFDLAQKQQGIYNETVMTGADAAFATKVGKIKGDYQSLTGQAAYDAFPAYQESINQAFQETRSTLPTGAQHGFDMLAARSMANHIADGSTYAASQLKAQQRYNGSDIINLTQQGILDPNVAASDERFGESLGTIKHETAAQIDEDHPGLKKDPETGVVSFDESTPEGRSAKAEFQRNLDNNISQAYANRYNTLAKQDPVGAYDAYQKVKDTIPKSGQVAIESSLAPKIFDAHKQTVVNSTVNNAEQTHYEMLTNPNNSVATIMKNELHADGVIRVHSDGDGQAIGGINSEAFPAQFKEAKNILDSQGQVAAKDYIKNFYQKEIIEKNGVDKLPDSIQDVVADGLTNHWSGFQKDLLNAAQAGASRDELIQMRREEYQRLVMENPAKYEKNMPAWTARLDNLQKAGGLQQTTEGKKTYATNENGGPLTQADYYRTHSTDVLARGDAYAQAQMPGDLAFRSAVRQTLQNHMSKVISEESAQHMMDNKNIMRAINGSDDKPGPQTEDELRAMPGMAALLDDVAVRDPKFSETIPTLIAKAARRNTDSNSPNAYDTILRTLAPKENPNRIGSEDHLVKSLGRSDGTGINMKDYNDAKAALDLDPSMGEMKKAISDKMKDITNANGNLDGKGQDRAVAWYNQTMQAWKQNTLLGKDKAMSATDFVEKALPPVSTPSRMGQLSKMAEERAKLQNAPHFDSWDNPDFIKLQSGEPFYTADGQIRYKK